MIESINLFPESRFFRMKKGSELNHKQRHLLTLETALMSDDLF